MVISPPKAPALKCLTLNLLRLFCCTLVFVLLPVYALATAEALPEKGKFCRLDALENALSHYRQLATRGVWPQVPAGPTLREGDSNERISFLKQRLVASNDLVAPVGEQYIFDAILKEAVQRFQVRHGLTADGHVGIKTLRELNVPLSERIAQLAAGIEHCRTLPPLSEHRYILVNIADFTLQLFEDGKLLLSMPVIVGTTKRQTPVLNSRISSLILNPNWTAPHSIATEDILPKIKKNPDYLKRRHFRVLQGGNTNTEIDPATIDWASLSQKRFPYRLRQDSGSANALGRMKFIFPNSYDVYLHDTPSQELFKKDARTFSSGCIRLARPRELAVYLLQDTRLGSIKALNAAIFSKKTQSLTIPSPIAIYIIYMTTWVDPEGIIQFRPDIYDRNPI